jgi:hypothetical protein
MVFRSVNEQHENREWRSGLVRTGLLHRDKALLQMAPLCALRCAYVEGHLGALPASNISYIIVVLPMIRSYARTLPPMLRVITHRFPCIRKQTRVNRVTIKVYETLSESLLHKSAVVVSSSNNKSEIRNKTLGEVNIMSINSEVAPSQRYVRSLSPDRWSAPPTWLVKSWPGWCLLAATWSRFHAFIIRTSTFR